MKASGLREQTAEELRNLLADTRRELGETKTKRGVGEDAGNPLRIRMLRRDVARILTVLRGKAVGQA